MTPLETRLYEAAETGATLDLRELVIAEIVRIPTDALVPVDPNAQPLGDPTDAATDPKAASNTNTIQAPGTDNAIQPTGNPNAQIIVNVEEPPIPHDPVNRNTPCADWGEDRTIDAGLLIALCMGKKSVHPKGIRIRGARITGSLDLESQNIPFPVHLEYCWIDEKIQLEGATLTALRLSGSRIPGLVGERLTLRNSLYINDGFFCEGEFILRDAVIAGSINGEKSTIRNPSQQALTLTRLRISGGIYLENASVDGEIHLTDAEIGSTFSCRGSQLRNEHNICINAIRAVIKGAVFLNNHPAFPFVPPTLAPTTSLPENLVTPPPSSPLTEPPPGAFSAKGLITLYQAQIGGSLEMQRAWLDNSDALVLRAIGIVVKGPVLLIEGFQSRGQIDFSIGNVGGSFECSNATFIQTNSGPDKFAFRANELKTGGSLRFGERISVEGPISIRGANISGELFLGEGTFNAKKKFAIDATRAIIGQGLFFQKKINVYGGVRLIGSRIGGNLELSDTKFERPADVAFDGSRMSVGGSAFFRPGVACIGEFRMQAAKIGLEMHAYEMQFLNNGNDAFIGDNLTTGGDLNLTKANLDGAMHLRNAVIGSDLRLDGTVIKGSKAIHVALNAQGAFIKNTVFLRGGFSARGTVIFSSANIGGDLNCRGAKLDKSTLDDGSDGDLAFSALNTTITGSLIWEQMGTKPKGPICLMNTRAGKLNDDIDSWPIHYAKSDSRDLLLENFTYNSCSTISAEDRLAWLRSQTDYSPQPYEQAARVLRLLGQVADARKIARAKQNDLRRRGHLSRGSKCWNFFLDLTLGQGYQVWRVPLIALAIIITGGFIFGHAADLGAMMSIKKDINQPDFQPFMYSADVFLPVINLHQKDYWLPSTKNVGYFYMGYLWAHIFFGWLMTTIAIAGLTGIVKKD